MGSIGAIQDRLARRGKQDDDGRREAKIEKRKKESLKDKSRLNTFGPGWKRAITLMAALFSLYILGTTFIRVNLNIQLALYLGVTLILIFLVYRARENSPTRRPSVPDFIFAAMALVSCGNYWLNYEAMLNRVGLVYTQDYVFAFLISIASIEAARRVLGWALPIIALVMVGYAYFGAYMPDLIAHSGMSGDRIVQTIYSTNGVFGIVTRTFAIFVIVFIIFGAFLQQGGAGTAFTNLAIAAFGKRSGGAAKAAVASSGLAGSVLGSGAANIAVTGTFTIPLMKKRGYPAHVAAALETVASLSGQLLPPVMGAAAFVMASFIGVPYVEIIAVATIPALLMYWALYFDVHFYTKRHNLESAQAIDPSAPTFWQTLKTDGPLLVPLVVLVASLVLGYSPFRGAVFAIIAAIITPQVLGLFHGRYNFGLRKMGQALVDGAIQSLVVGASAGVLGILVGSLLLPGTGLVFSSWVVNLSGGVLFIALLLIILASYVLGMGMTVTAAYIVMAIVAAPALTELGVPIIAAHLVVIWVSLDSSFTPPFALGAFVAAGIGDADPMKTAWRSVLIGKPIYIIPMLMVFTPLLGLDGYDAEVFWTIFTSAIGLMLFSGVTEQYLARTLTLFESLALSVAVLLLFWPTYVTGVIGLAIGVGVYLLQKRRPEEHHPGPTPVDATVSPTDVSQ